MITNTMKVLLGLGLAMLLTGLCLLDKSEIQVVRMSQPKVVKIGIVAAPKGRWIGSGAIISPDGTILTCAHLFNREIKVFVKTESGQVYNARVIRVNHKLDLAVIKIDPLTSLPYFKLGEDLLLGQRVLAFGSPLNIQGTISVGYVENLGFDGVVFLQGAPINPGNSGGPLVDLQGHLVGVNVAVLLSNPFQVAQGMGIAVNLSTIREFIRL